MLTCFDVWKTLFHVFWPGLHVAAQMSWGIVFCAKQEKLDNRTISRDILCNYMKTFLIFYQLWYFLCARKWDYVIIIVNWEWMITGQQILILPHAHTAQSFAILSVLAFVPTLPLLDDGDHGKYNFHWKISVTGAGVLPWPKVPWWPPLVACCFALKIWHLPGSIPTDWQVNQGYMCTSPHLFRHRQ
jgi:hypothetical protein